MDEGEKGKKKSSKDKTGGLMLKITNLPHQRPEPVIHEALYFEFYNYSMRPEVRLYNEDDKRYALVKFKSLNETKIALKDSQGINLFGSKLKLSSFDKNGWSCDRHMT
jgi:hypothetical protein